MWAKKVETYVSGVFPSVRAALSPTMEPQDVFTAAAVALGVPALNDETSTEIGGQLFIVLSALTDGESVDVVTNSRRRSRLRELAQVGGARSSKLIFSLTPLPSTLSSPWLVLLVASEVCVLPGGSQGIIISKFKFVFKVFSKFPTVFECVFQV